MTGDKAEPERVVNFEAVQKSLDSTLLIDVRKRSELISTGQIPNSVCVPVHEIVNGAFQLSNEDFNKRYGFTKPIQSDVFVLTCRSGRRVLQAEEHLKSLGYDRIKVYLGSFNDWMEKGGKTIKAEFSVDDEPS